MQKVAETAVLLAAGGDGSPHPFVIALAHSTAGALRDAAIDHAMANLLLGMIIRWLNLLCKHEAKVVVR